MFMLNLKLFHYEITAYVSAEDTKRGTGITRFDRTYPNAGTHEWNVYYSVFLIKGRPLYLL